MANRLIPGLCQEVLTSHVSDKRYFRCQISHMSCLNEFVYPIGFGMTVRVT